MFEAPSRSPLIVLDRDGVINQDSDNFIKSPEEWIPIEGSLEAITRLNQAGYRVVVATNQSGIARGLFDLDTLMAIHEKMNRLLAKLGGQIDGVFYCPHGPDDDCRCRKPQPGMFEEIGQRFDTAMHDTLSVGDSLRDLLAARAVGSTAFLLRSGKGERTLLDPDLPKDIEVFDDLSAFVDFLLD